MRAGIWKATTQRRVRNWRATGGCARTFLDLGNCGLTEVPGEVRELVWLERLTFASEWREREGRERQQKKSSNSGEENKELADIRPLSGLTALQSLDVSGTQVSDLGPLSGLTALQSLNVRGTQVSDLSALTPLIATGCPCAGVHCFREFLAFASENCPLTNPPPEIVKQGNEAILNYFEERRRGGIDHLYEAKMLILGECGAGKTSLLRRLYEPDKPLETTKGISIYRHEFQLGNGRRFLLNVWDFGGQEIYHARTSSS
jgi:Leucine-rich repeat (LRR) protein